MDSVKSLDQIAAHAGQLYSLPAVAMKVLELTRNGQVDVKLLQDCIENDPALASRVFRVVNSSAFSPAREVTDLGQALNLLGVKALKLLVLGFSLPSGLFLALEQNTLKWYWRHALTKAVAARSLNRQFWRIPSDEAFLAALFQDLGVLVLFQQLGPAYSRLVERSLTHTPDLLVLEKQALGFTHVDVSVCLLRHWGFPESLVNIVAWQPPQPCTTAMHRVMHLAGRIARWLVDGHADALEQLLELGQTYCGNLQKHLETLVIGVGEQVHDLAGILALEMPADLEYRDLLAEAHRQLVQITTQVAGDLVRDGRSGRFQGNEESIAEDFDALTLALSEACQLPADDEGMSQSASTAVKSPPRASAPSTSAAKHAPASAVAVADRTATASSNLLDRLTTIIAECRTKGSPVSLLLLEIGNAKDIALAHAHGADDLTKMRAYLGTLCGKVHHPGMVILPYCDHGFSMILPYGERRQAVAIGHSLTQSVRHKFGRASEECEAVKLGVGIATAPSPRRNFPPQDLIDSADRCLYAAHASGGRIVKSIEIY